MIIHTTEVTSATVPSDNPIHQRLLFPYLEATRHIKGDLLEIGCGEGRGLHALIEACESYTGIDRNPAVLDSIRKKYGDTVRLIQAEIPPLKDLPDEHFDHVVTFQVIEHIEDDELFLKEIYRVLKPGGSALITTPNIKMSLTRNPWHVREYTLKELQALLEKIFRFVDVYGIYGNDKVNEYYERNKESVRKITRFDIFNLQYRLPRSLLKIPYDILNRINRNRLKQTNDELVMSISVDDYYMAPADDRCFDFFAIALK